MCHRNLYPLLFEVHLGYIGSRGPMSRFHLYVLAGELIFSTRFMVTLFCSQGLSLSNFGPSMS